MPTYEYQCTECGKHFERFQNLSDAPVETCPKCGGGVERLISGGGAIIVKGGAGSRPTCGLEAPCCGADSPCGYCPVTKAE